MRSWNIIGLTGLAIAALAAVPNGAREFAADASLSTVLQVLGDPAPNHALPARTAEQIEWGRQLVFEGKVTNPPEGKSSKFISPYFSCTSCHNSVREESDITTTDPEDRLAYAEANNLPYLQASTFWGIANRRTWYNDDYVLKYGDLVKTAEHSLRASTQLCAQECSQGRALEEWELDAIVAYYWSVELTLADLHLTKDDWNTLNHGAPQAALDMLHTKYMRNSPATFGKLPQDLRAGYGLQGRPDKGKILYEHACQHCHRPEGESDVILDNYPSTFKWLKRNMFRYDDLGLYHIVRKGTYADKGWRPYMPHFTEQKMSDQQVEDLRVYIEQMAE